MDRGFPLTFQTLRLMLEEFAVCRPRFNPAGRMFVKFSSPELLRRDDLPAGLTVEITP